MKRKFEYWRLIAGMSGALGFLGILQITIFPSLFVDLVSPRLSILLAAVGSMIAYAVGKIERRNEEE